MSVFIDLKLALTAIFLTLLQLKCNVYLIFVIKMTKMTKARQSLQISHSRYSLACVQTITKLWLVPSAKQRRDPCSGPPADSTNYRKCVSNFPSTWLAITSLATNKTKVFFNWPIVVRTQIWVHSWKSRTRISALFRDGVNQSLISSARRLVIPMLPVLLFLFQKSG